MDFEGIDLSGLGPFAENQTIRFNKGINVVKGPNGSGKTTIFRALERQYRESSQGQKLPKELSEKLVFVGENSQFTESWGEEIVGASLQLSEVGCMHVLPTLISHHLNQMIAIKVLGKPKGLEPAGSKQFPFQAAISARGDLLIADFAGVAAHEVFRASGEQFLLALACNLAIREIFNFSDPLVLDNAFGMLDDSLFQGCHKAISGGVGQAIYLLSEASSKRVPVAASNVLERTTSGKTYVKALGV